MSRKYCIFRSSVDNEGMTRIFILMILISTPAFSSVTGVTTHPLSDEARVISGELMGFFNRRHEMGAGLRYTHAVLDGHLLDLGIAGGQYARSFTMRAGLDFELLDEESSQPRVSIKPFWQNQRINRESYSVLGAAPTLRKSVSLEQFEFYPFIGLPNGIAIDGENDELDFYSSVSFGASMPFPGAQNDKLALTLEGNKNLGAADDYVSVLVSWIWK